MDTENTSLSLQTRLRRNKSKAKSLAKLRHETFMAYGGCVCACCDYTQDHALTLDHINGDGAEHRRELSKNWNLAARNGVPSSSVYRDLKKRGWPPGHEVLCANCQLGRKKFNGVCPCKKAAMNGHVEEPLDAQSTTCSPKGS